MARGVRGFARAPRCCFVRVDIFFKFWESACHDPIENRNDTQLSAFFQAGLACRLGSCSTSTIIYKAMESSRHRACRRACRAFPSELCEKLIQLSPPMQEDGAPFIRSADALAKISGVAVPAVGELETRWRKQSLLSLASKRR